MSQYTFSFTYTEFERIPRTLAEKYEKILSVSDADATTKKLVSQICEANLQAIADIAEYSKDQLHL